MTFEPSAFPTPPEPADLLADLGATLVDSGAIDRRTLDRARRVAGETGARLDQVLTQLGLMSDRGLAEALARLIAAPLAGPADYPDAPLFDDRLKAKFLRRARALPIAATDDHATLAMADPLDGFTRNAVAAALGPARDGRRRHPDRARGRSRPAVPGSRRRCRGDIGRSRHPMPSRRKKMPSG